MPIHTYIYYIIYVFSNRGSIHEAVLRPLRFSFCRCRGMAGLWRGFVPGLCVVWSSWSSAQLQRTTETSAVHPTSYMGYIYLQYIYMGYISYIIIYIIYMGYTDIPPMIYGKKMEYPHLYMGWNMAYVDYKLKTTDPSRGTRMSKYPSAIITTVGWENFQFLGSGF